MTTQSQLPLKWYVPFANAAASANFTELPVTTADPTRASQSLGFPPLTMEPPESGGVPPQGPDINGGMNQIARVVWWLLNGGGFPYDPAFASNSNINGYPNGAVLQRSDFQGEWLNLVDNNQINPDTATGALSSNNWAPLFAPYGRLNLTGLTGGTLTLTYSQAAFERILVNGTLTSNQTIIVPNWSKRWLIVNNTAGAFTLTIQPPGGTAVNIPQNASETAVVCDGTNLSLPNLGVNTATQPQQPAQLAQVQAMAGLGGAMRNVRASANAGATTVTYTGDEFTVEVAAGGTAYKATNFSLTLNLATTGAGGMDTGSATASGYVGVYMIYNPTANTFMLLGAMEAGVRLPTVYGGAHMPSGYTASALIGVLAVSSTAGQLTAFSQADRHVWGAGGTSVLNAGTGSNVGFQWVATPVSAVAVDGNINITNTSGSSDTCSLAPTPTGGPGVVNVNRNATTGGGVAAPFGRLPINPSYPRSSYYTITATGGSITVSIAMVGYDF